MILFLLLHPQKLIRSFAKYLLKLNQFIIKIKLVKCKSKSIIGKWIIFQYKHGSLCMNIL